MSRRPPPARHATEPDPAVEAVVSLAKRVAAGEVSAAEAKGVLAALPPGWSAVKFTPIGTRHFVLSSAPVLGQSGRSTLAFEVQFDGDPGLFRGDRVRLTLDLMERDG